MTWESDHLTAAEKLHFCTELVKVGTFECRADEPCFQESMALDNDVFVLPQIPVWIRRDAGEYRFAEPGAVLMHRAGSTLLRRCSMGRGERTFWFGVRPDVFVDALQRYSLPTRQMGGALITDPKMRYRIALFLKQLTRQPVDKLAVEADVLTLFFDICAGRAEQQQRQSAPPRRATKRQRRLVDKSRAYLDAHLGAAVGLQTVANDVGTSLFHLCRLFREQTGLTMHAYRTRQRLGTVVERLVGGESNSLAELALDSGFASHSHLSRVFQKQMGVPPSAVRATISAMRRNRRAAHQ